MVRALVATLPPPPADGPWGRSRHGRRSSRRAASSQAASSSGKPPLSQGIVKSAITCGLISSVGDVLAQAIARRRLTQNDSIREKVKNVQANDWFRTARMFGFGTLFYGPFQHVWYQVLSSIWPTKSFSHFFCKLTANQLALGPLTLVTSFAWNYALLNRQHELGAKLRRDGMPTLKNGWKFWVPAASLNFLLIPLQFQVIFMSLCSVCWTGYLSNQANTG